MTQDQLQPYILYWLIHWSAVGRLIYWNHLKALIWKFWSFLTCFISFFCAIFPHFYILFAMTSIDFGAIVYSLTARKVVRKSNGHKEREREKPDGNFEFGSVYVCLREREPLILSQQELGLNFGLVSSAQQETFLSWLPKGGAPAPATNTAAQARECEDGKTLRIPGTCVRFMKHTGNTKRCSEIKKTISPHTYLWGQSAFNCHLQNERFLFDTVVVVIVGNLNYTSSWWLPI